MKTRINTQRLLIVSLTCLMMLTTYAAGSMTQTTQPASTTPQTKAFTHAVFAEDATATWCGYCHFARAALDAIYQSHDYPFYYVCLVDDMDTHAHARTLDYNLYGFPTVFFDGGNQVVVGGWTGAEAAYRSAITTTGARTVSDIDVNLNVNWLGNAAMDISTSVTNNEASTYTGHIRVYVVECNSSMGWKDTTGHVYTMALLDYALNQDISINAGDSFTNDQTWDGHNYNDGHGHNFGSIQSGNIEVIAVVYNSQSHQGYAYPPSSNPFTAYWVDDAAGVLVGGSPQAPDTPAAPSGPTTGNVNVGYSFSTSTTDPQDDQVLYNFDFGDGTTSGWIGPYASGATATTSHTWNHAGTFNVKVQAKDTAEHTSGWSANHGIVISAGTVSVDVAASKNIIVGTVKNTGSVDLTNIAWSITIKGGMLGFINKANQGTIDSLAAGASTTVQSGHVFGFGIVRIKVIVGGTTVDKQGIALGPILKLR